MPHQCVRCKTYYEDGAKQILQGCVCGGRLFFYIKQSKLEGAKKEDPLVKLNIHERKQIEDDVFDLVGSEVDREKPVVLDLESIKIIKPGTYELDLVNLFKEEPLVFKLEEGKYMIDLLQSFKNLRK